MSAKWGIYHGINFETGRLYDLEMFDSAEAFASAYEKMYRRNPPVPSRSQYRCPYCDAPLYEVFAPHFPPEFEQATYCANHLCEATRSIYLLPTDNGLAPVSIEEVIRARDEARGGRQIC